MLTREFFERLPEKVLYHIFELVLLHEESKSPSGVYLIPKQRFNELTKSFAPRKSSAPSTRAWHSWYLSTSLRLPRRLAKPALDAFTYNIPLDIAPHEYTHYLRDPTERAARRLPSALLAFTNVSLRAANYSHATARAADIVAVAACLGLMVARAFRKPYVIRWGVTMMGAYIMYGPAPLGFQLGRVQQALREPLLRTMGPAFAEDVTGSHIGAVVRQMQRVPEDAFYCLFLWFYRELLCMPGSVVHGVDFDFMRSLLPGSWEGRRGWGPPSHEVEEEWGV